MADRLIFEVIAEGKGIKVVQRDTDALAKSVERTNVARTKAGKGQNAYNKREKGIHQSNLSSAKGFSKINQTLGGSSGLVGAYATLAANVFAATAAFGALRSAAQVEQLAAGLEEVGLRGGRNLQSIAENLREITGLAISTEEAMRSVAIGISAGFSTGQMEQLTLVAKGASLALGRDMGDAMSRLIRGAAKLEPEILDELGIMVRLDEATQNYAATLGKSVDSLSQYERRMAFINAINQEGLEKFGDIATAIDTNPYDRLAASLADLVKVMMTVVNKGLGPIVNIFGSSMATMFGGLVLFGSTISRQLIPGLYGAANAMRDASARSAGFAQENLKALKVTGAFPKTYNKYIASYKAGNATMAETAEMQKQMTRSAQTHQDYLAGRGLGAATGGDKLSAEKRAEHKAAIVEIDEAKTHMIAAEKAQTKASIDNSKAMALSNARLGSLRLGWSQLSEAKRLNTTRIMANTQGMSKGAKGMKAFSAGLQRVGMSAKFAGTALLNMIPWIGTAIMISGLFIAAWKKWGPTASAAEVASDKVADAMAFIGATQEKLKMNVRLTDDAVKKTILTYTAYAGAVQTAADAIIAISRAHKNEQMALITENVAMEMSLDKKLDTLLAARKAGETTGTAGKFKWNIFAADAKATFTTVEELNRAIANTELALQGVRVEGERVAANLDKIGEGGVSKNILMKRITDMQGTLKKFGDGINDVEQNDLKKLFDELKSGEMKSLANFEIRMQNITTSTNLVSESLNKAGQATSEFAKLQNKFAQKTTTPYDKMIASLDNMASQYDSIDDRIKATTKAHIADGMAKADSLKITNALRVELETAQTKELKLKEKLGIATRVEFEVWLKGYHDIRDAMITNKGELKAMQAQEKRLGKISKAIPEALQLQLDLQEQIRLKKIESIELEIQATIKTLKNDKEGLKNSGKLKELRSKLLVFSEQYVTTQERGLQVEIAVAQAIKKTLQLSNKILQNEVKLISLKHSSARAEVELANLKRGMTGGITPAQELMLKEQEHKGALNLLIKQTKAKVAMTNVEYDIIRLQTDLLRMQIEERLTNRAEEIEAAKAKYILAAETGTGPSWILDMLADSKAASKEVDAMRDNLDETFKKMSSQLSDGLKTTLSVLEKELENKKIILQVDEYQIKVDFASAILSIAQSGGESTLAVLNSLSEGFFTALKTRQEKARKDFAATTQYIPGSDMFKAGSDAAAGGVEGSGGIGDIESLKTKLLILKGITQSTVDGLKELGPQGALAASVAEGSFAIAASFGAMVDSIDEDSTKMQVAAARMSLISSIVTQTANIIAAASSAKIAGIDQEIDAEKRRDGKSAGSLAKIKAMQVKKDKMARKAFETNKKMQMATAVISTAAAITGALALPPIPGAPWNIALAVIMGVLGAAQLAIIAGTSYQGGGNISKPSGPSQIAIGERSSSVDLGKSAGGAGELAYLRGESGRGTSAADFKPGAFAGRRYRAYGGSAYVVGEQGPELFMPEVPGQIVTNDNAAAMGAPVNVSFQISAIDSTNMEDMLTTQRGNIISMIREAANSHGTGFLEGVDVSTYDATAGGNT